MPPKQQIDKGNWQWAESTDPTVVSLDHVRTAYRLDSKPCTFGQCKRNCKKNPFCINSIGEKVWFGEIDDRNWHDVEDPENERKPDGMFVGLKNLGATCYVNTFLQLWFFNPKVRDAIYDWRGKDDETDEKDWKPSSVCSHLQVIFGLLQSSKRRYVDPSEFISFLGLDAGQQQDAQEFSKLFLSILEENLIQSTAPNPRNIIKEQFCGAYAYVTKCSNCSSTSERMSDFYELDLNIRGHKTLEEAIKGFLEEEKLEGDNQYMCGTCNGKQNATRAIQLKHLPPVLNLQLLRFVFEKNVGQKKKLNSFIQFPDVLEMAPFLNGQPQMIYDLTAVLIHRGPSAYSGHYVAHIRGKTDQTWYKFNDEEIEQIKGRGLQLGNEEDPSDSGQKKTARNPKGCHSSRNAYMLVYTKRTLENEGDSNLNALVLCEDTKENGSISSSSGESCETSEKTLPRNVVEYVRKDNDSFEDWVMEMELMKSANIATGKEKQEKLKSVFHKLVYSGEGQFEWIPMTWLTKWLADPSVIKSIDNSPYICSHGRVDPDKTAKLKCVSTEGADILYELFGGGPRICGNLGLCEQCVRNTCSIIRTKKQVAEDDKLFQMILKSDFSQETCFFVGKGSYRSWRRLALERVSDSLSKGPKEEVDKQDAGNETSGDQSSRTGDEESQDDDENLEFNEDLLCDCKQGLHPDPSKRKVIPEIIWYGLKKYFPSCPEFRLDCPPCENCLSTISKKLVSKDVKKQQAVKQKSSLTDLYLDKKRPLALEPGEQIHIISTVFVEKWRQFIKNPHTSDAVDSLMNSTLLCSHGHYLFPPEGNCLKSDDRVTYLWPNEWSALKQFYCVDVEILLINLSSNGNTSIISLPEVCQECLVRRLAMEASKMFEYENEVLYIRKVNQEKLPQRVSEISDDPDFIKQKPGGRKRSSEFSDPPEKIARFEVDGNNKMRKGQRHRRTRGEKEVKVSSTQTLRQLKLEVMKLYDVPPFDQNLFVDGRQLTDNDASLCELRITPGSVITLKADEPVENIMFLEDSQSASGYPESGFKGTSLLSA